VEEVGTRIIEFLSAGQSAVGLGILFVSAAVEYLFPPFPGDTVTLFGAFLASQAGWNVPLVFIAVTGGSVAGAAVDYGIGWRLGRRPVAELQGRRRAARERVAPILAQFARHGAIYVAINRFLPGVRAFFFVAAGMARLPLWQVLVWGGVSAAVWNGLLIGVGFALGQSWERLRGLLETYTVFAWVAAILIVALILWRALAKKDK
jgi:membrane protein DedA with SNARE-associated domain